MNLAYTLCEENINNINSYKDSYISYLNKISDLTVYRDCKEFVSFVNKEKLFTFYLLLMEIDLIDIEQIERFLSVNQKLIDMVKKYPDKNLKRKYLRLDNDEIEIFDFSKIRLKQIKNNQFYNIKEILKNSSEEDEGESFDTIPVQDLIYIMIGCLYIIYAEQNADFLTSVTKKIIKKSFLTAKRYSLIEPVYSDFEKINKKINKKYKRALDVLSK